MEDFDSIVQKGCRGQDADYGNWSFGVVLANYLLLLALENAPTPNIVMAMAYSAPVFTILGGILIFRNGVNMMELLGMGLTIGGIAVICLNID